jgi:hypothetical protein
MFQNFSAGVSDAGPSRLKPPDRRLRHIDRAAHRATALMQRLSSAERTHVVVGYRPRRITQLTR